MKLNMPSNALEEKKLLTHTRSQCTANMNMALEMSSHRDS
jgi:hypothetical protein